jgi:hypothetical protein
MPDLPPWLPPALTLIVGYFLKTLSDWFQHRYMSAREREARQELRRERLLEQRTLFQRQTLLDLQKAMYEFLEVVRAIHLKAAVGQEKTEVWPASLPADLAAQFDRAESLMEKFLVRVRDEQVPVLARNVRSQAVRWFEAVSADAGHKAMRSTGSAVATVNERIGGVLRQLDDELQ